MKKLIFVFIISAVTLISNISYAGNCNYPNQMAKDGSRCGQRAASVRPGGRL